MKQIHALIKDSVVINMLVFEDPSEELLNHFKNEYNADIIMDVTNEPHCNVNTIWDGIDFKLPQPYPSWEFDEEYWEWIPPVPYPLSIDNENQKQYTWNESILDWEEVSE